MSNSFVTPWTVACQASLSVEFSRQEYWSGWPLPSPGDLPDPGIEPASPMLPSGFFTTEAPGKPINRIARMWAKSLQSCLTLLDPTDHIPPDSSVSRQEYCYALLQGIFPTQGPNPFLRHLLHWQLDSSPLRHQGSPLTWLPCFKCRPSASKGRSLSANQTCL